MYIPPAECRGKKWISASRKRQLQFRDLLLSDGTPVATAHDFVRKFRVRNTTLRRYALLTSACVTRRKVSMRTLQNATERTFCCAFWLA